MKAVVQDVYGDDVLELRDIERPVPGPDEVVLRVHAAGVGPDVWHLVTGLPLPMRLVFGLRRPRNPVPGWDGAGEVAAVGTKVTRFKPGDAVFGQCRGSFAEFARAKAARIAPKPVGTTFEQAAALPVSGVTALQALEGHGRMTDGQKVLIVGASGGVGSFAVQLAAARGAEVTGVCGTAAVPFVRSLGARDVIDYTRDEITAGPGPYDIVLNAAGNRPLATLRRVLAPDGTLVHVGGETGGRWNAGVGTQLRLALLSPLQRQTLRGLVASVRHEDLLALKTLVEEGAVAPVVDRTFPMEEAVAAVRHLRTGHPRGKVVLGIPLDG
ncbi:NAD(P)-dependent alcohol dehydrogenase [Streptomyces mangrovisoli]|uniref:NAD(P)-dependent alcohol dehydrogenase n=1 Tax=Streptomyces mangrovisoli TaxID=1428628 RepID=A0A1J4NKT3_9ACTN|nr:NAD(P)-dependent alcohol dehydrogenase [Streptomyces mangrovisoli]OIJ62770.1 NAD(P)-dependent alcohol dehydrogenase [Streptomyces mangrovisoli]